MIQSADDDPIDAGRIMGSPGHGGEMKMPGIKPDLSNFYNAEVRQIAARPVGRPEAEMSAWSAQPINWLGMLLRKSGQEVAKVHFCGVS